MCSMDIFVDFQPFSYNFKGGLLFPSHRPQQPYHLPVWVSWRTWGSGTGHSIARPCVPITSPLTHMVYFLPFTSYSAGSKSVFAAHPTRIRRQLPLKKPRLRRTAKFVVGIATRTKIKEEKWAKCAKTQNSYKMETDHPLWVGFC